MIDVEVEREIRRDADEVWALLADFGNPRWVPGLEKVDTSGEGVGMTRTISVPVFAPIEETLDSIDERARVLEYSTPRIEYLDLANCVARVQVEERGAGRCLVRWRSRADATTDAPADRIRDRVRVFQEGMLDWIEEHFGHESTAERRPER